MVNLISVYTSPYSFTVCSIYPFCLVFFCFRILQFTVFYNTLGSDLASRAHVLSSRFWPTVRFVRLVCTRGQFVVAICNTFLLITTQIVFFHTFLHLFSIFIFLLLLRNAARVIWPDLSSLFCSGQEKISGPRILYSFVGFLFRKPWQRNKSEFVKSFWKKLETS